VGNRIAPGCEYDRNCGGGCLGGERRRITAQGEDRGDLLPDQVGRQRRQPLLVTVGRAILEQQSLAFDQARILEALAKTRNPVRIGLDGNENQDTDHQQRWLLRARCERP
jgi:hypothetical protein